MGHNNKWARLREFTIAIAVCSKPPLPLALVVAPLAGLIGRNRHKLQVTSCSWGSTPATSDLMGMQTHKWPPAQ